MNSFAMPDFLLSPVPTFAFELCGLPVTLSSPSTALFQLYTDYFRYYDRPLHTSAPPLRLRITRCSTMPALPATAEFLSQIGQVQLWRWQTDNSEQFFLQTDISLFRIDPQRGRALGLVTPAAFKFPHLLVNTYTFAALLLLLRWHGCYHLHTAAVVSPRGSLHLICGAQRAGKTTLTTALGISGWQAISDDGILLQANEDGLPAAYAFKRDFHLAAELLSKWNALHTAVARQSYFDRACVDGLDFFQTKALAAQPLVRTTCVLFPTISATRQSRLESMPPHEAIHRLIEQSMFFPLWRAHTQQQLHLLTTFVKDAFFYRLYAGADLWENPQQAAALLHKIN